MTWLRDNETKKFFLINPEPRWLIDWPHKSLSLCLFGYFFNKHLITHKQKQLSFLLYFLWLIRREPWPDRFLSQYRSFSFLLIINNTIIIIIFIRCVSYLLFGVTRRTILVFICLNWFLFFSCGAEELEIEKLVLSVISSLC